MPKELKPRNESGMRCPLTRKSCWRSCHTCEFWQPIEVLDGGKTKHEWRCAVNWLVGFQGKTFLSMDSLSNPICQIRDMVSVMFNAFAGKGDQK